MDHRIQELEESLASALGALPDIRVPTAMLVLVAVMTWMVMVSRQELQIAPSLRDRVVRRRRAWTAQLQRRADTRSHSSTPRSTRRRTMAPSTPHRTAAADAPAFTVRWGRTAIFLVAVLALATFLVTGIASAFGAATVTLAGISLLVGVGSLATLRGLAVRDMRRRRAQRVENAFAEAANPSQPVRTSARPATASAASTTASSRLFDQQPAMTPGTEYHPTSTTAEDITDTAATETAEATELAESTDATETAAHEAAATEAPAEDAERPEVARVPRPMYLDADEVARAQPEPLEPEAEPTASSSVQLKDGVSAEYQAQIAARAQRRLDLDKVLERRRAI